MRVCGVGDNVVDRYLGLDCMYPGGNALNVAVFCKRAGIQAAYLGITGSDEAGALVREALVSEGVETTRMRVSEHFNAFSQIGIDEGGNRYFIGSTPPPYRLELDHDDMDYLAAFDFVHTGDYGQIEGQLKALSERSAISFDFGSKPRSYSEALLPYVSVATFSAPDDADTSVRSQLDWARAFGVKTVIVTRGARGSVVCSDGQYHEQAPYPTSVVDSLGAGDAYIASLIVGFGQGRTLAESAALAARAAADVCTYHGAFGYGRPLSPHPVPVTA